MLDRNIDIVTRATDEISASLEKCMASMASFSDEVHKGASSAGTAAEEIGKDEINMRKQLENLSGQLQGIWAASISGIEALLGSQIYLSDEGIKRLSLVQKMPEEAEDQEKMKKDAEGRRLGLDFFALSEEQKTLILKTNVEGRKAITDEETVNLVLASQTQAWAEQSRADIVSSAYKSMEEQMLSLVETGRFSTEAFGEIIYQQVKMELVALSAKSAVQALYYTALGFGLLATGNPLYPAAFEAAAGFALISGATYGAAAGVQAAFWGQEEYAPPASSTGRRASGASLKSAAASSTPLAGYATDMKVNAPQNITIQIYNPLSEQNWQKIVEDNIVPAINSASERNIAVTVKNMGG